MTARLSFCVKAAKDLSVDELDALTKGIEGYRESGVGDAESQLLAVTDLEAEALRERETLMRAVREQAPEAFVAPEDKAPRRARETIEDLGEKVGGARKDTSTSTGVSRRRAESDDDRPAWARRFKVSQVVTPSSMIGQIHNAGRWVIRDTRTTDWMGQPKQVGRVTFATQEEAEAFVPIAAVGLKHRVTLASRQGEPDRYEIWRDITDRKRVKVVDKEFGTRDDAMAYMAAHATEILEANTTFGEADMPLPPDRARTGPERRKGDVKGEDFMREFSLRAVEFGNWQNQDERQALMNDAWDGLHDLADVLGVPPKALGLNGDLALAFGARGHGLQSARAHYERPRAVINLTKEKGAGSLAHEWFHALDHYFGRQDGKASAKWKVAADGTRTLDVKGAEADMASGGFRNQSGVRPEVREAYEATLRTMTKKAESYVDDTVKVDKFTGSGREDLAQRLDELRRELSAQKDPTYYNRNNKPAGAELLTEFDAIAKAMLDGEATALATEWRHLPGSKAAIASRWTNDNLERLSAIYKEVRGRTGFDATNREGVLDKLRGAMERYSQRLKMLAEAQTGAEKTRMVPTQFAMDAKQLDQGRGGDYWTTPHEMAARAFQGYVEDKISERGGVSRFLNYAPENVGIITPWGAKRPFPAGDERRAINKAFDTFVGTLKTREDEAGNVALYSTFQARPFFLDTKFGTDEASPQQAYADAVEVLGFDAGVEVVSESRPDLPGVPMLYELDGRRVVYNTAATHDRAADVEYMIEEIMHSVDHVGGQRTISASNAAFLPGGEFRVEIEAARGKSAAMREIFVHPLDEDVSDTVAAAELFARAATLYHADPDLLKVTAPKLYGRLDAAFGRQEDSRGLRTRVRQLQQGRSQGNDADRVRGRDPSSDAGSSAAQGADGLRALRQTVAREVGGSTQGSRVAFRGARRLETRGPAPPSADTAFARAASGRPAGVRDQKRDVQQRVREKVADVLADSGAKVSWFDRTLGTQYSKAKKHSGFKRVFELAQQYIEDTSSFANEAADQARDILPKLETWRDLTKHGIFQHGMSAKDSAAVAAPVFEGTLTWTRGTDGKPVRMDDVEAAADKLDAEAKGREMFRRGLISGQVLKMWQGLPLDQYERNVESRYASTVLRPGIVWTDAELEQQFGLSERQGGLYRQFRASVETSLDQVLAADIMRLLKITDPTMRELAVNDRDEFKRTVDEVLVQRREEEGDATGADLAAQVQDKYSRVQQLKDEGYAPLMRFGKYKVYITDAAGETLFFGLYENGAKANEVARLLAEDPEFKGAKIERGVLSEEQFKLFSQVPLDSLEMFAEAVGAEKSKIYQDFIKLAKSNRSALKRLINRKGTSGFSDDVPRVLAAFVASNSRLAAGAMSIPAAKEAAADIRDGDVQDEAIKLLDTVESPKETAGVFRGLMFMNFIGGSIASALVNVTQPLTMTLPYLSQWGGGAKAAARLMAAGKQAAGGGGSLELRAALKRAEADGIVSPQEIHHLTAQAMGTWGSNPIAQKLAFIWASPFSLAEQFNRRISFIAAFNTAKEYGIDDPFAFAEMAVTETQGLYNKANAPNWARNPIGASALTFKQFSIHYLEWMTRMYRSGPEGKKAVLLALALLVLAAGVDGLPFASDADDLVDTLGQALGYDTNAKRWRRDLLANELGFGDEFADLLARGASAAPGVPFDVSLRMSMGNMIPATGLLLRSNTDRTRDVLEVAGPAGGLAKQYLDAGQKALSGEFGDALLGAMPVAIQNIGKAAKMWETGEARDTLGRKVMDADELDAAMRFLGFNPAAIARESEKIGMIRRSEQLAKNVEGEIANAWARAMADGDGNGVAQARERLVDWNEKNHDQPIRITSAQILRRVKAIRRERAERFITSVAPERRARVAEELRQ